MISNDDLYEEVRKVLFHPGENCLWDLTGYELNTTSQPLINCPLLVTVTKQTDQILDYQGFTIRVFNTDGINIEMFSFRDSNEAIYPDSEVISINNLDDIEKFKVYVSSYIKQLTENYLLQ